MLSTIISKGRQSADGRIGYLDGHRGAAILIVILYHAYARWPELVPYGDQFAQATFIKYGWLGVQLFFLISGFVILMTLERCTSARQFMFKRWTRLFPAMLVCSLLIFLTSFYFIERPAGQPTLASLLPGLTFIQPDFWKIAIADLRPMEGAFWSLYVEFKFYIFAAVVYFWRGREALLATLALVFAASLLLAIGSKTIGGPAITQSNEMLRYLSFQHFGWFASGAALYVFTQTGGLKYLGLSVALGLLSAVRAGGTDPAAIGLGGVVVVFFLASIFSTRLQRLLSSRALLFFGLISYPLYLIHENMMISMIIKLDSAAPFIPAILLPALPLALLSVLAYLITLHVEPPARKAVLACLAWRKTRRPVLEQP